MLEILGKIISKVKRTNRNEDFLGMFTGFDKQIFTILIWLAALASMVLAFPTCHESTLKMPKAMAARMVMSWER